MSQEGFQSHTVWREAGISLISLYCSSNCLDYYVTSFFFVKKVILLFLKEKGCQMDTVHMTSSIRRFAAILLLTGEAFYEQYHL